MVAQTEGLLPSVLLFFQEDREKQGFLQFFGTFWATIADMAEFWGLALA
jgi:hypothetical protein